MITNDWAQNEWDSSTKGLKPTTKGIILVVIVVIAWLIIS